MSVSRAIFGTVAPGFERVRDAFEENFSTRGEVGAAFSAYVDGREVANLWGGEARPGLPWTDRTMIVAASVAKGFTAFIIQRLADQGKLDIDAPVSAYWPEFAANGKDKVRISMVLDHTAGLPYVPDHASVALLERPATLRDLDRIASALAAAPLVWEPGTQHGYHSITYGWILGEIVRRVTGKTLGTYLRDEIARPLDLDYWIGLPASEHDRVAHIQIDPVMDSDLVAAIVNASTPLGKTLFVGDKRVGEAFKTCNDPDFWSAEVPAAGGIGSARGVARLYALLARGGELDGERLVSPSSIERFQRERLRAHDMLWNVPRRLGLGYMRPTPEFPMGPSDEAFGHAGLGGSIGFADPSRKVGFGYVMSQLVFGNGVDARAHALAGALYASLD